MTYLDEGFPELRQARADRDRLLAHIESLPAHIYWNAREFWDMRLAEADAEVDRQIEAKCASQLRLEEAAEVAWAVPQVAGVEHETKDTSVLPSRLKVEAVLEGQDDFYQG